MRPLIRRRTVFGPLALAVIGAIAAIAAPLGATGSSNVEPAFVSGTPTCSAGEPYSFKIDNINESQLAGTWTSTSPGVEAKPAGAFWTGVTFTISAVSTGDHTFSWSAAEDGEALDVASVIVKGGPNANVYSYDDKASSDSGLHAPVNKGKRYYGLSHIVFCISPAKPHGGGDDGDGDDGDGDDNEHCKNEDRDDDHQNTRGCGHGCPGVGEHRGNGKGGGHGYGYGHGCRPDDDVCPKNDEGGKNDHDDWDQGNSWGDGDNWGDWKHKSKGHDGDKDGHGDDDGKDKDDDCKPPPPPPTTTTTTTTTTPKPPPPPPSKVCPTGLPYSFTIAGIDESKLAGDYTSTTTGVAVEPSGDVFWTGVKFTISGVDASAHTFNWSAARDGQPLGVDAVIVRGRGSALLYRYNPEVSSATGLHAPPWTHSMGHHSKGHDGKKHKEHHSKKHGKHKHGFQRIKSITFCLDKEDQPPTPPPTTTTTTPPTTITTTVTTTTTTPVTTLTTTVTTTTPGISVSAPPTTTGTTPDVTPPTPRRGSATASISPGCLRKRSVRVSVRGTAMRRIVFRLNGRRVKTVTVRSGQRVVRATLTTDGSRVQRITAVVSFSGGRTARTLRVTGFRCVRRTPPLFTG